MVIIGLFLIMLAGLITGYPIVLIKKGEQGNIIIFDRTIRSRTSKFRNQNGKSSRIKSLNQSSLVLDFFIALN